MLLVAERCVCVCVCVEAELTSVSELQSLELKWDKGDQLEARRLLDAQLPEVIR